MAAGVRSPLRTLINRSPVPLTPARTGGFFTMLRRATLDERLMTAMSEVGTLFAIVNRTGTAVAKADWHLYRTAASGLKEDRVEVTDPKEHPMIELWARPNPMMNRRRFVEAAQQHVDLVGENALVVAHIGIGQKSIPFELWPVRPDRITPVPDPYTFLAGYVYTSPEGEKVPLEPRECLRIVMPNPRDPYRGLGPVQSILTDIDSVKYSAQWNRAFFENSAEPGGVVQVPTSLNDNEFERLRAQWSEDHQGVTKAHRVAILDNDAKWISNSFTQRDMQFAELRGVGRDVILEAFGFPKGMLGIVEDVNRSSMEGVEYLFERWIVEERLDRWRDMLNFELLPQYGDTGKGLEWDYDSPVASNSEQENAGITARSAALALLAEKGFEVPDLLAWLDLPEMGYTKPEPKVIAAPPGAGKPPAKTGDRA